jgi:hypothetical protein
MLPNLSSTTFSPYQFLFSVPACPDTWESLVVDVEVCVEARFVVQSPFAKNEKKKREKKYGIADYFYPNTSFELEVPGKLRVEVGKIIRSLQELKLEPTTNTVYTVLLAKRDLIN